MAVVGLAGCSSETVAQLKRVGLPVAASNHAPEVKSLWVNSWIAAGCVGVLVWGLIVWCVVRYRRRSTDLPKQNRYNLPMEIMYTVAPFVIIGALFYWTVVVQDKETSESANPQHTVHVVAQKWAWTFNYKEASNPAVGNDVWETGTPQRFANLYLPVNQTVRFNLTSPDVNHSFWVPSFYFKMDVIPGRKNSFELTPTKVGVFKGKCAELCGTYHSTMLFNLHVVSLADYEAHLKQLAQAGNIGENTGPGYANTKYEGSGGEVNGG